MLILEFKCPIQSINAERKKNMEKTFIVNENQSFSRMTLEHLTRREMEVLRQLADGMSNQEIATYFVLSENTVKYHVHSILDKLGAPDRKVAAQYAREQGLIGE